jgi:hypothetical protein
LGKPALSSDELSHTITFRALMRPGKVPMVEPASKSGNGSEAEKDSESEFEDSDHEL